MCQVNDSLPRQVALLSWTLDMTLMKTQYQTKVSVLTTPAGTIALYHLKSDKHLTRKADGRLMSQAAGGAASSQS